MRRRRLLQLGGATAGLLLAGRGRAATLPRARALDAELAAALARGEPLVAMASLEGCPFCRLVRDRFLAPLHREQKLAVVQLDMGSHAALGDFAGRPSTHGEMLRAWHVESYPTVLFFGRGGAEAASRLVGASIPDFYGYYLEEQIRVARAHLA